MTLVLAGGAVLFPNMSVQEADVLIDQQAGVIEAVGPDLDGDRRLDASNGLVIPGLVNAHTHTAMTLLRGYADDEPLETWLRDHVWPIEGALTSEDVRVGTELAAVEMIRSGTTSFADMYFHMESVLEAVDTAGLRARIGHGIVTVGKDEAAAAGDVDEGLAVAREYDGAAGGRVGTMVSPHSLTTVEEEHLRTAIEGARESGVPIHLHANETAEEVAPIVDDRDQRPLAYAADLGLLESSDFLAHCVHVDETEIDLLARSETSVVHCPASNMKLASGAAPIQQLLAADVSVALGTDGAASNNDLDVFDEMRDAAMLGKLAADDAAAVPAPAVVRMATAAGADTLGFDAGRIEPGRQADVAVVDLEAAHLTPRHDLLSHLVYAARGSDVRHTICDGQILMRDRDVQTLDEQAVIGRARERAADLVERVE
jgi:5-methylthioadenosine/S-adenosylhomocysteine deaminase